MPFCGKEEIIMDLVKALSEQYMKAEVPQVHVGDTVRVSVKVKESISIHFPHFISCRYDIPAHLFQCQTETG